MAKQKVEGVEETIEVSKSDFEAMMKRIENIERAGSVEVILDPSEDSKVLECRVVLHEGRPVDHVENVVQKKVDEQGQSVMVCDVFTLEEDGEFKKHSGVDYHELRRRDSVKTVLLEKKIVEEIVKGSVVDENVYNDATGKMQFTGRKVRLITKVPKTKYKVSVNGEEVWLNDINISGN